jgi:N-acetylmuramic acid 6-phosphate etherase
MLTTGLAIREGRVYSKPAGRSAGQHAARAERQIAIVMAATDCSRSEAKAALASCNQHCRTAILMLLSGLDAWQARELLADITIICVSRCARRSGCLNLTRRRVFPQYAPDNAK